MADMPNPANASRGPHDDRGDDLGEKPDLDDVGTPRWVKAFAVVAAVLVLLFIVLHLARGGFRAHGGHG